MFSILSSFVLMRMCLWVSVCVIIYTFLSHTLSLFWILKSRKAGLLLIFVKQNDQAYCKNTISSGASVHFSHKKLVRLQIINVKFLFNKTIKLTWDSKWLSWRSRDATEDLRSSLSVDAEMGIIQLVLQVLGL